MRSFDDRLREQADYHLDGLLDDRLSVKIIIRLSVEFVLSSNMETAAKLIIKEHSARFLFESKRSNLSLT